MGAEVEHILLTRFNLPSPGAESFVRAKEGWLRDRVSLFERYCLPSVRAQSEQRFSWIVYIDPLSPEWFLDRMTALASTGVLHAVPREQVGRDQLLSDIRRIVQGPPRTLITTNLDNDDGLAVDFVERVRTAATAPGTPGTAAVYLTRGLVAAPSGVYLRTDRHNAFCSVREPWDGAVTCWADWHNRLPLHMPATEVAGSAGWLQVVHGTNVSNRVRGRRVSPATYRAQFPGLLDGACIPSGREIATDRLFHGPRRAARESARAAAKRVALGVLGRDGLDRAKGALADARARASA